MKNFITKYAIILASTILLISATWSCRTSSRNITKEKVSIDSSFYEKKEVEIKNDSTATSEFYGFSEKELQQLFSRMNFKFSGKSNKDSAEIEFIQTKDGIKLKLSGIADAEMETEAKNETEKKDSILQKEDKIIQNKTENSETEGKSNVDKSNVNKEMEFKSKSVPFWIYLFGFLLLVLIVALYWFFGIPKKTSV